MTESETEMIQWLNMTEQIDFWEMSSNIKGFEARATGLDPNNIPDGWGIVNIIDNWVFLQEE